MRTSFIHFVAADVRRLILNFEKEVRASSRRLLHCRRSTGAAGLARVFLFKAVLLFGLNAAAVETTNNVALNGSLGDVGASLGRVMLALALVLGIFLGGVWLFRNWQRLTIHRGQAPKLNVIEARSLGGRHALYVVGYEQERFLVAASPTGINLLTHLQPAEADASADSIPAQPGFAQALAQKLRGK
jgi:flagellar biogenesis protein FliO